MAGKLHLINIKGIQKSKSIKLEGLKGKNAIFNFSFLDEQKNCILITRKLDNSKLSIVRCFGFRLLHV